MAPPSSTDIMIPKWFIKFITVAGGFFITVFIAAIPWAMTLSTDVKIMSTKLDRLSTTETQLHAHLQDSTIHAPRLNLLQQQIDDLERRLVRVEK